VILRGDVVKGGVLGQPKCRMSVLGVPPQGGGYLCFNHKLLAVKFKTHNLVKQTYCIWLLLTVRNAMAATPFF